MHVVIKSFPVESGPAYHWLVVYLPLWKIWKSVGMIIPNIWKNKNCSKPPTSIMVDHQWQTCNMRSQSSFLAKLTNLWLQGYIINTYVKSYIGISPHYSKHSTPSIAGFTNQHNSMHAHIVGCLSHDIPVGSYRSACLHRKPQIPCQKKRKLRWFVWGVSYWQNIWKY